MRPPQWLKWYARLLREHPLPTKMTSAFIVVGSGDLLAQKFLKQRLGARVAVTTGMDSDSSDPRHGWAGEGHDGNQVDWKRTAKMAIAGACIHAPMWNRWLPFLERQFLKPNGVIQRFGLSPSQVCMTFVSCSSSSSALLPLHCCLPTMTGSFGEIWN